MTSSLIEFNSIGRKIPYTAIVFDKDKHTFSTVSGEYPDKKSVYNKYSKGDKTCRRVLNSEIFNWISNNAENGLHGYMLYSTAFSKWKDSNTLKDYYMKLIKEIPQMALHDKIDNVDESEEYNIKKDIDIDILEEDYIDSCIKERKQLQIKIKNKDNDQKLYIPHDIKFVNDMATQVQNYIDRNNHLYNTTMIQGGILSPIVGSVVEEVGNEQSDITVGLTNLNPIQPMDNIQKGGIIEDIEGLEEMKKDKNYIGNTLKGRNPTVEPLRQIRSQTIPNKKYDMLDDEHYKDFIDDFYELEEDAYDFNNELNEEEQLNLIDYSDYDKLIKDEKKQNKIKDIEDQIQRFYEMVITAQEEGIDPTSVLKIIDRKKAELQNIKNESVIEEEKLSDVETKYHTPEGLFTGTKEEIIDGLIKDANGDEGLALKRINYYINRAGSELSNKTAVNAAKDELKKKVESNLSFGDKIKLKIIEILNV